MSLDIRWFENGIASYCGKKIAELKHVGNNSQGKNECQFSFLVLMLTGCDNWCKSTFGWDWVVIISAYQSQDVLPTS